MSDLISIIVPVYKVEEYLDECVKSLVDQSYTNLEIILVDDGSPDNSPQLCDTWAKKDSRIKVIHKQNSGVCDSRNAGLDIAKGNYISFVDSDDIAESTYIEVMYKALQHYPDCGIVSCCAVQFDGENTKPIFNKNWEFSETRFIEPEDYADGMLTMKSQHSVWCKLFKNEILSTTRFRNVYANEELFLALDLYPSIEKEKIRVVEIPDKLYLYRINPNGICHSAGCKFALTETACRELLLNEVKNKKPLVYNYYLKALLLDILSTIHLRLVDNATEIPYYVFCRKLWKYSNNYSMSVLNKKEFMMYICLKYFPSITYILFIIKRIRK